MPAAIGGDASPPPVDAAADGAGDPPMVTRVLRMKAAGAGRVTTSRGSSCLGECTLPLAEGTALSLTAQADEGASFGGWSGDCSGQGICAVTMDRDRSVTATFTKPVVWERSIPGPTDLVIVSDGIVVTGTYENSVDLGGRSLTDNSGKRKVYLAKYSFDGDPLWATSSRGSREQWSYQLAANASGETFVTGNCEGGQFQIAGVTVTGPSINLCSWLIRVSPDGQPSSGRSVDGAYPIDVDGAGDLVMGNFAGSSSIVKTSPSGEVRWRAPSSLVFSAYGLVLDASANVFACGYLFEPHEQPAHHMIVVKLSPDGTVLWKTTVTTTGGYCNCYDIQLDQRGDVYMKGRYSGTIDLGADSRRSQATTSYQDAFFAKFSGADGRRLWAKAFVGSDSYRIAIAPDAGQGLYALFHSVPPLDFGQGPMTGGHLVRYDASTGAVSATRAFTTVVGGETMVVHASGDLIAGGWAGLFRLAPL